MKLGDVYVEVKGDTKKVQTDLKKLKKSSDTTSKAMTASWKKVGVAMVAVAAATGIALVAAKKAFNAVKSIASTGDDFHKMALRVGESAEALSALEYVANISGTTIETVEKGLKYLTQQMNDFKDGTGEAAKTFEALGIIVTDVDGRLKSPVDTMKDVADKLAGMSNASQQAAYAMELFGSRAGTQLLPMLKLGSAGIEDLIKKAEELGLVVSTKFAARSAALVDALRDWKGALDGIKMAIVEDLLPQITNTVIKMTEWVTQNRELVKVGVAKWIKGITIAVEVLTGALKLLAFWASIVAGLFVTKLAIGAIAVTGGIVATAASFGKYWIMVKKALGITVAFRVALLHLKHGVWAVKVAFVALSTFWKFTLIGAIATAIYGIYRLIKWLRRAKKEGADGVSTPSEPVVFPGFLDLLDDYEKKVIYIHDAKKKLAKTPLPTEEWIDLVAFAKSFKTELGLINYELEIFRLQSVAAWEDYKSGAEEAKEATKGIKAGIEDFRKDFEDLSVLIQDVTYAALYDFSTGMTDAFMDWVTGINSAKDAFKDFAASFLSQISRMIIQTLMLKAVSAAMGWAGGLGGGAGPSVPVGSGYTPSFANGGIATGPKSGYPVTLHGTEKITPLNRSSAGNSIEKSNINISVNVDAKGGTSKEEANEVGSRVGKMIGVEIDKRLSYHQRPGGMLNRIQARAS